MLARGIRPAQFFNSLLCNAESHSQGRQMSAHMSDPERHILSIVAPVGNNALQAVGVASAINREGNHAIVVCSMGDGSSQQGEVLEAIAEAVRSSCRCCSSSRTIGARRFSLPDGEAENFYGLPIHRVDGRDPVAAFSKVGPVVASIRTERKPTLIVFEVERLSDHINADDELNIAVREKFKRQPSWATQSQTLRVNW